MTNFIACIVILFITQTAFAEAMALPLGWRLPTNAELSDDWRKDSPERYAIVKGDFNGDGVTDQAMQLISMRRNRLGLLAFVSQKNNRFKRYLLDTIPNSSSIEVMGIAKAAANKYPTACGKGYWGCKGDEVPELALAYDGIDFFRVGSANSIFYWDKQKKTFKQIWISD